MRETQRVKSLKRACNRRLLQKCLLLRLESIRMCAIQATGGDGDEADNRYQISGTEDEGGAPGRYSSSGAVSAASSSEDACSNELSRWMRSLL